MARMRLTRSGTQVAFLATETPQPLFDDATRAKRGSTWVQNVSAADVWVGLDANLDETNGYLLPAYTEGAGVKPFEIELEDHSGQVWVVADVTDPTTAELRLLEFFD